METFFEKIGGKSKNKTDDCPPGNRFQKSYILTMKKMAEEKLSLYNFSRKYGKIQLYDIQNHNIAKIVDGKVIPFEEKKPYIHRINLKNEESIEYLLNLSVTFTDGDLVSDYKYTHGSDVLKEILYFGVAHIEGGALFHNSDFLL